jgi:hypothetical protein
MNKCKQTRTTREHRLEIQDSLIRLDPASSTLLGFPIHDSKYSMLFNKLQVEIRLFGAPRYMKQLYSLTSVH